MPTADSLNREGASLYLRGDANGARLHYSAALRLDPEYLPALANMAVVESDRGNLLSSLIYSRKIVQRTPNDTYQLNNLGNTLTRLEQFGEAQNVLERAAQLAPDMVSVWHNLALLHLRMRNYEQARSCFAKVEALGSRGHQVQNDIAHVMLALGGDLREALSLFEARWHTLVHLSPWDYHIPEWQGQNLFGKNILFHAEQGFGDDIMAARFAHNLVALGARVGLCVPGVLFRLFEQQHWFGVTVVNMDTLTEDDVQGYDYQSPMYSAMRWLKVKQSDISGKSYLLASPTNAAAAFGVQPYETQFNIGICWASGKRNTESDWRRRITDLNLWLPLAAVPNVQLWSLQKFDHENMIEKLGADGLIRDPTPIFNDFADTASFVSELDLVICVDTAIAHLAGALGVDVIMLSQYSNCWRWWNIDSGSGAPWYDTMTIIRQTVPGDWKHVLERATEIVRERARRDLERAA